MRTLTCGLTLVVLCGLLAGCETLSPQPRLPAYLGTEQPAAARVDDRPLSLPPGGVEVMLVVINDTSHPGSAPALSKESLDELTTQLRALLEHTFPLRVTQVLHPTDITPNAGAGSMARLGQEHGIDHVLIAVFSSIEREVPAQLPLSGFQQGGLSKGSVLGYQAQSYALVELALLGAPTGRVLVAADGRAWSELERLNVPLESNVYPVVRRSQRQAPIYPTEENAKDVMRGVATSEAIDQAVMHLAEAWPQGVEHNPG